MKFSVAVLLITVLISTTLSTNGANCVKFVNGELKAAAAFTEFKDSWIHFEERMIADFKKHKHDKEHCENHATFKPADFGKKANHAAEYHKIFAFIHA